MSQDKNKLIDSDFSLSLGQKLKSKALDQTNFIWCLFETFEKKSTFHNVNFFSINNPKKNLGNPKNTV
jgi:hypothetical protein